MNVSRIHPKLIWLGLALAIAIFSRLIPHAPNWTAIGALALWGATFFNRRSLSLVLPLTALILTDLALGFHSTLVWVYAGFLLVTLIGWILPADQGAKNWITGSLIGSLVFFAVSNFGVWMSGELYPKTLDGLVQCFVMALPFFENQLGADLFFNLFFAATHVMVFKTSSKLISETVSR